MSSIIQLLFKETRENHWTFSINDISPRPSIMPYIELWKVFANGIAATLAIYEENLSFVLYVSLGHAGSGSQKVNYGEFVTLEDALHNLLQECQQFDFIWDT